MTFTRPRSYHHGDLRLELLQRAEETLRESGVDGLSLRQLARDLGVSHGAPSRHFRDKQALLDALALAGFERLGALFTVASGAGSFAQRLESVTRTYVDFATENSALLELMFARKHSPTGGTVLPAAADKTFAIPMALIADGQANGDVVTGDPARIGFAAFATMQGMATLVSSGFVPADLAETMLADVTTHILNGLTPRTP
ncbi:TetR/AcrR family transcriptional regulator [Antrihabitans sp. YC2-6]|uniref:TetR/AcrR family transcriptional regulator n=1 Tax=Antrihabitans sp. YC2-6 TaxID=2799498 RepID=UPI0018F4C64E|nr:TetR/AcrR family transcriptional regulator [Antrihabitans sp. YC2-6]MBJ8344639.1 TetR/AcrR family transcriptional regulator [Antrihabitans sp. YC2-6]